MSFMQQTNVLIRPTVRFLNLSPLLSLTHTIKPQQRSSSHQSIATISPERPLHSSILQEKGYSLQKTATAVTLSSSKCSYAQSTPSKLQQIFDPNDQKVYSSLVLEQRQNEYAMKTSLIQQLAAQVSDEPLRSISERPQNKVNLFECIEEKSLNDEESYDFDDRKSQVVELSEEEKELFGNFIPPTQSGVCVGMELEGRKKRDRSHLPMLEGIKRKGTPDNKKNIIRNFFKSRVNISNQPAKYPATIN